MRIFLISAIVFCSALLPLSAQERTRPRRQKTDGNRSEQPSANDRVRSEEVTPAESDTEDTLKQYTDLAKAFAAEDEEETELFFHQCQHISCLALQEVLQDFITPQGTVSATDESDVVVVTDIKSNIKRLKLIADRVDARIPQILVEAQIVELTLDSDFEKEVKLAFEHIAPNEASFVKSIVSTLLTPGANPTTGQGNMMTFRPYVRNYDGGKRNELSLFLRYLETKGKATILSAPNLILRRGSEGSITTGEEVPILQQTVVSGSLSTSTVFKSVGIKMKVKPTMINEDTVNLVASPEVSTVTGYTSAGENGVANPIIAVRKATTELEVKDNELISIGGLLRSEERVVRRRVPIAGSVPVVGHLFRSNREETVRTQLVIFMRIKILDEGKTNGVTVFRPSSVPDPVQAEIDVMEESMKPPPGHQILRDFEKFREDGRDF